MVREQDKLLPHPIPLFPSPSLNSRQLAQAAVISLIRHVSQGTAVGETWV